MHLIRDAQASGGPHPFIDSGQIPGRRLDLAASTGKALGDETGRRMPALRQQADDAVDIGGVFRARLRVIIAEATAIGIGKLGDRHPVRHAGPAGPVEFIRADVDGAGCMAVIGMVLDDHPAAAAMRARRPKRQLVRLRPRGDETAMRQMRRKLGAQRVGKPHLQRMDVARIGVQKSALTLDHGGDPRMRLAGMRHVVTGIKVGAPMLVTQIMPPAAQNLQRAAIGQLQIGAEPRLARCDQRIGIGGIIDQFLGGRTQKIGRVGIKRRETGKIVRIGHPGQSSAEVTSGSGRHVAS